MRYWPWKAFFTADPGRTGVAKIWFCPCAACEWGVKRQRLDLDFGDRPFVSLDEPWWDEAESVVYPYRLRFR